MSDIVEKSAINSIDHDIISQHDIQGLYDEYRGPLVSFFGRRLPKDEDPEDMTQQVFIKLVEAVKHTELIFSRRLIFVIAKNALIDRLRWRKSHRVDKHDLLEDSLISCETPLPDRILQGKQQLDRFFNHLDDLPLRCKQVFLLHRVCNISQQEIADHLGISRSTVQKHMMNAMAKLHDNIGNLEDL
ncbi:MAG: sigma-70 family RNA polymerase sigma factor [Emcibacter sp.]|nr:sigma-70 family RNA polymerase sigma factor [Emcibacter sp.]